MKKNEVDAKTFEELLESVREGGAILRGKQEPSRRFTVEASDGSVKQEGLLGA